MSFSKVCYFAFLIVQKLLFITQVKFITKVLAYFMLAVVLFYRSDYNLKNIFGVNLIEIISVVKNLFLDSLKIIRKKL